LFDSADDQKLGFWWWGAEDESNPGTYVHDWIKAGDAKLSDYRETSLGLQVIFQF
jgi:hypothetical protein